MDDKEFIMPIIKNCLSSISNALRNEKNIIFPNKNRTDGKDVK